MHKRLLTNIHCVATFSRRMIPQRGFRKDARCSILSIRYEIDVKFGPRPKLPKRLSEKGPTGWREVSITLNLANTQNGARQRDLRNNVKRREMAAPEEAEAEAGRLQAAEQGSANTGAKGAGEGAKAHTYAHTYAHTFAHTYLTDAADVVVRGDAAAATVFTNCTLSVVLKRV